MPCFREDGIWICFSDDADVAHCKYCGHFADYLCDWPMGENKTCDTPLCEKHAFSLSFEDDLHFCPIHLAMYEEQQKRKFDIMPGKLKLVKK